MRACLISSLMKSGSELQGLYSLGCRETILRYQSHDGCDDDDTDNYIGGVENDNDDRIGDDDDDNDCGYSLL